MEVYILFYLPKIEITENLILLYAEQMTSASIMWPFLLAFFDMGKFPGNAECLFHLHMCNG